MNRLTLIIFFLVGAPLMTVGSILLTDMPSRQSEPAVLGAQIYAALPDETGMVEATIVESDARNQILESYLSERNSPLATASATLVEAADENDLDFRLLAAISLQESNGCRVIPPNSHNCWGWGIHARGTLHFNSLEEGIYTVSEGLKEKYIDQGLTTPDQIMTKYTPSSPGTWAAAVNHFMDEME